MSDFDHVFKAYFHSLIAYAVKFVRDEEVAADLVQDVFTMIWEKQKYDLESDHLKAYLYNSTRNTCLNYLKHQKVVDKHYQQIIPLLEIEFRHYETGEKSMIEKESIAKILKAIHSLSDIQREVLELSRFEGLKNKEIAQKLDIPVRTVETRLFRALSALKEKLSQKLFHIFLNIYCLRKKNT